MHGLRAKVNRFIMDELNSHTYVIIHLQACKKEDLFKTTANIGYLLIYTGSGGSCVGPKVGGVQKILLI